MKLLGRVILDDTDAAKLE